MLDLEGLKVIFHAEKSNHVFRHFEKEILSLFHGGTYSTIFDV